MTDAQRLDKVRKIYDANPEAVRVLDYFDERSGRWNPSCYEVTSGSVTVLIGIVFGDILFYRATPNLWQFGLNKSQPIPDECRDTVDELIDKLVGEISD